jgi:hypothetical protein
VVGIPMLTSARSLGFWLRLCSAGRLPGAAEQLQRFQAQEAAGPVALRAFCHEHMSRLIGKVCASEHPCSVFDCSRAHAGLWHLPC